MKMPPITGAVRLATLLLTISCLVGASAGRAYEIGRSEVTWQDPDRNDRPVPAYLYYPAEVAGQDVPVAPAPEGGFPILSFGHGFLMSAQLYDYVWQELVPAGYVVILPQTETGLLPDHLTFGQDLAFLARRLGELGDTPGSPFHGRLGDRSAVAGHSMGGGAALLAAAENGAFAAVVGLAAAETNPSAIAAAGQITVPSLLLSGSVDCVTPPAETQALMHAALAGECRSWLTLQGASHCQFAESSTACNLGEALAGCDDPTLSRQEQHELVMALLRPWLDAVLRQEPGAWAQYRSVVEGSGLVAGPVDCDAVVAVPAAGGHELSHSAHPNPFNPGTTIRLELPRATEVRLDIHDLQGRLVRQLVREWMPAGGYDIPWDGRDEGGRGLGSGLYFYRVQAAGEVWRGKLTLLK